MATLRRRTRTADYSEAARLRLGEAIIAAREADGHRWRPSFAKAAGISQRSLSALEQGEPTVGEAVLRSVGRTLSGWTEDTPVTILDGGDVPTDTAPAPDERDTTPSPEDELQEAVLNARRRLPPDKFHEMIGKVIADLLASRSDADRYGDTDTPAG